MKNAYIMSILFAFGYVTADPALVLYLQRAPYAVLPLQLTDNDIQEKASRLAHKTPDQVNHKQIKRCLTRLDQLPSPQGFVALYNGYADYSNHDGLLSFPLRHHGHDQVRLVITPSIKLRKMAGNSFAYQYVPDAKKDKRRVYTFAQKTDKHNRRYWQITKESSPDTKIDRDDIVLLTDPHNVYVDERDCPATKEANVVLPNVVYIVGRSAETQRLLKFIDSLRWFEPITFEEKVEADKGIGQRLMTNR